MRMQVPLAGGANDGRENLLAVGPAPRAVAARDVPRDRRAQRLFGAPVGGVDGGIEEETLDRVKLSGEVPGQSRHRGDARKRG